MGLQVAVAAPFKQRGTDRLAESEFVVALSLDRDWFTADQAKRLVDVAVGQGLLERDGEDLVATFSRTDVDIPDEFTPDESLLQERSTFELVLDDAVAAGTDKQSAVAGINETQSDLGVAVEAAAVVYARREGLDAASAADRAREELDAPALDAADRATADGTAADETAADGSAADGTAADPGSDDAPGTTSDERDA